MAKFKYIQLAIDIEEHFERARIMTFTSKVIKFHISEGFGYYRYSDTTLYKAIRFLENTGKVVERIARKGRCNFYQYLPKAERERCENGGNNDRPF